MHRLSCTVPSWVVPGTVAENALFLHGKVAGVMLCAFECSPRLAQGLPHDPQGLEWHIHLPLDLPWQAGGVAAARAASAVWQSAAHLIGAASYAILHIPHENEVALLDDFIRCWRAQGCDVPRLVLENEVTTSLERIGVLLDTFSDISLCLDLAHLVLSGVGITPGRACALPEANIMNRTAMIHWSAPLGSKDAHAPLDRLEEKWLPLYRAAALSGRGRIVDVIEVFDWSGAVSSAHVLDGWRGTVNRAHKEL